MPSGPTGHLLRHAPVASNGHQRDLAGHGKNGMSKLFSLLENDLAGAKAAHQRMVHGEFVGRLLQQGEELVLMLGLKGQDDTLGTGGNSGSRLICNSDMTLMSCQSYGFEIESK